MDKVELGPSQPAPGRLPPGEKVYAVGDIHGREDLLSALLDAIRAEASATAPDTVQTLIFLGDYIDRGPESRGVVETLASTAIPNVAIRFLRGNHEAFMLEFIDGPSSALGWFACGGAETLRSYGVQPPPFRYPFDRSAFVDAASDLRRRLPAEHGDFLSRLGLSWRSGSYFFTHAGIRPGTPLTEQYERDLLWIRDPFLSSNLDHGAVVVHGHSISSEVELRPNRIGIDTGAFASGRLSCLILERSSLRIASTRV